jgi:parallel beta-helix repeat protein
VIIQAAPGVNAEIDAVLQGDPAGGNTARQNGPGIFVVYNAGTQSTVTLRNLTIRNFLDGISIWVSSKVIIDRCRIEHNRDHGVRVQDAAKVVIVNSTVSSNGRRIPVSGPSSPGNGITANACSTCEVRVAETTVSHNVGAGIAGTAPAVIQLFKVSAYFNSPNIAGSVAIAPDHNFSQ